VAFWKLSVPKASTYLLLEAARSTALQVTPIIETIEHSDSNEEQRALTAEIGFHLGYSRH
jgi:hypothetical protein